VDHFSSPVKYHVTLAMEDSGIGFHDSLSIVQKMLGYEIAVVLTLPEDSFVIYSISANVGGSPYCSIKEANIDNLL
jgi:hypothetical protein